MAQPYVSRRAGKTKQTLKWMLQLHSDWTDEEITELLEILFS